MKKIRIIILDIIIVLGILVLFINLIFNTRTMYKLSPDSCLAILGTEPDTFFNVYYDFYSSCEDFRKKAHLDIEGNLVLYLNKKQEKALLDSSHDAISAAKNIGIIISDDYSAFIIECDAEEIYAIMENFPLLLTRDLAIHQLLDGKESTLISVTCIVKDAGTGTTVYKATWPQEVIQLSFDENSFSQSGESNQSGDGSVNQGTVP